MTALKQKTVSSARWAGASQILKQILQLGIGIMLTRLLTPADFGLVGMVYIFSGFAGIFSELGIGSAIIQKHGISNRELSSAFWLNVISGAMLTTTMILAAPFLAAFFKEPRLTVLAQVISATFLISSLSIVHFSLLQKEFRFRDIAVIENVSYVIGGVAAIIAALIGFAVWSLVMQVLVTVTVKTLTCTFYSKWKPERIFVWSAIRGLLPFSLNLTAANVLNYWIRNADNLLIGKFLGEVQLGIYTRAYMFMLLPVQQISGVVCRVMFPAFSSIQDDIPRMKTIYLKVIRIIALAAFPASLGLMAVVNFFVLALLGPEWSEVIPILQVLCVLSLSQSLGRTTGFIYKSLGRTDIHLKWTIYCGAVYILSFTIGLQWGTIGVAYAYVISSLLFVGCPNILLACSLIGISFSEFFKNITSTFVCAVMMSAIVYGAGLMIDGRVSNLTALLSLIALGGAVYALLVWLFNLKAIAELSDMLKRPATTAKPIEPEIRF